VGRRAAFGADLPASAAFWRNSKTLRLIFGVLTIVPFFGACWRFGPGITPMTIIAVRCGCCT
jgi:hypothetical protein